MGNTVVRQLNLDELEFSQVIADPAGYWSGNQNIQMLQRLAKRVYGDYTVVTPTMLNAGFSPDTGVGYDTVEVRRLARFTLPKRAMVLPCATDYIDGQATYNWTPTVPGVAVLSPSLSDKGTYYGTYHNSRMYYLRWTEPAWYVGGSAAFTAVRVNIHPAMITANDYYEYTLTTGTQSIGNLATYYCRGSENSICYKFTNDATAPPIGGRLEVSLGIIGVGAFKEHTSKSLFWLKDGSILRRGTYRIPLCVPWVVSSPE